MMTHTRAGRPTVGEALAAYGGVAPGFNALRMTAALAVLVSHGFPLTGGLKTEPLLIFSGQTTLGTVAVDVFFAISGFLVTDSFLRSRSIGDYALRRALRIFPALIAAVALCSLLLGPAVTTLPLSDYIRHEDFRGSIWDALLVGAANLPGVFKSHHDHGVLGSAWTLKYEVICYAMLAVAGTIGLLRSPRLLMAAAAAAVMTGWWAVGRQLGTVDALGLNIASLLRFPAYFVVGSALYVWRDFIRIDGRLALAAAGLTLLTLTFGGFHLVFPIAGSYLVIYLAMQRALDVRFLHGRDYSYGFYLYAFPAQQLMVMLLGGYAAWWNNIILAAPLALLFAALSWHFVEKPALSLKHRWRDDATTHPVKAGDPVNTALSSKA